MQKLLLNRKSLILLTSVLFAFFIKLWFSYLPSFAFDMGTWFGWAGRLVDLGFSKFYSDTDWTQYTPGYLYYLWIVGKMHWYNELAIKVPVILADIGVGLMIRSLVDRVNKRWGLAAFFLYVLNPVVIFDGSVWGQIDGLLTLFLFLSAFFLIEKKSLTKSVFFWSLAFLIKPQSIAVLPAIILPVILGKFKFKEIVTSATTGIITVLVLAYPFFPKNPILGLPDWIIKMGSFYSYTSVYAFNIWSWVGFWKPDNVLFAGLALSTWGVIFYGLSILLAVFVFRKKIDVKSNHFLLFAILSLAFFVFPTKVHERYLFPVFAFLLTSAFLNKSKKLLYVYIFSTIFSFFNLYYPYSYYNKNFLFSQFLYDTSESLSKLIGLGFLLAYFAMLFWERLPTLNLKKYIGNPEGEVLPKFSLSKNTRRYALIAILAFALFTRTYNLGSPKAEYFDEVYHAFTAKVILEGDPKAWEWWNTPPEGYAYEWTHPPLAKLGMYLGMKVFGVSSFGYRIPQALLGVGSVYMVYLLAKFLFDDEPVALLSSFVFSLDGLSLVMSRIGMNDSYLLFFILLSVYFFLKEKDFRSAIFFGLALASKWSAIWAIPILGVIWLKRKTKFKLSLLWFVFLIPLIYLASYIPMFLSGHDLSVWWEMQKQMWWYHTGLKASHPYSSSWWMWPLLIRPIYLYTSAEVGGEVAKIYAFGNPLVFWFGLSSVFLSFVYAFMEKNKNLALVVFSYIIFFVPWAASPRIMFLYHYIPSLPFLAIATGYVLRRNKQIIMPFLISSFLLFIYFYPHLTGLKVPLWLDNSYYWVNLWR